MTRMNWRVLSLFDFLIEMPGGGCDGQAPPQEPAEG